MSKLTEEERETLDEWNKKFNALQKAVEQIGENIYLNSVDSSLAEPKERIDFYNEFSEKLKEGQEDNEERGRYDSGRTRNGSEQGDEGTGDNRPVGGNDDISRNAIQMGEQKRGLREAVEYAKRRAEALAAELTATKRENEEREAAGLEKRKPRVLSEANPWQEGDFDPPLNVDLFEEAERQQRRLFEKADGVPEASQEERDEIAARGKKVRETLDGRRSRRREMYKQAFRDIEDTHGQSQFTFDEWAYAAPNGKPSNLPDELWILVRTKAFKNWFGDWENDPKHASVALDENGEPLIVFHGPRDVFSVFRVPKELKDADEFNYRLDAVFFLRNGKT